MNLSQKRTSHGSGPNPITYGEMEAYERKRGMTIDPRAVEILDALDAAYLEIAAENLAAASGGG